MKNPATFMTGIGIDHSCNSRMSEAIANARGEGQS
jgi:hypothetical protein